MAFSVTAAAAHEILAAAARCDALGMALRVAARQLPGGIDYGMGFDEATPDDDASMFHGLTVLVASPSRRCLDGTVLDYVEIEAGRHDFIFIGPAEPAATGSSATADAGCAGGGCAGCGS
jgi:Fe-S cluster assembly iron-binding protein IscA